MTQLSRCKLENICSDNNVYELGKTNRQLEPVKGIKQWQYLYCIGREVQQGYVSDSHLWI